MTNSNSQIPDRNSPQYIAVQEGLDMIHATLLQMGRLKNELISSRPSDVPGKYEMRLVSKLLNRKRVPIGMIRVFVRVPDDGDDIKYRVEWTRNAYGFWYWKEFALKGAVDDIEGANFKKIRQEMKPVVQTADGTVPLRLMSRMYKKIKKSRVRDKVAQVGLQRG